MRAWMLCMAGGIGAVAWLPRLPPAHWLGVAAIVFLCAGRWRRTRVYHCALALVLGLIWGSGYGYCIIRAGLLPVSLERQSLLLTGTVADLVVERPGFGHRPAYQFLFAVDRCVAAAGPCAASLRRVRLSWYDTSIAPRAGERWQLRVVLKRPHGFANPGGFDYGSWLVAQRIGATGYVRNAAASRRLAVAPPWSIGGWRERARDYLNARLAHAQLRGLLLGLLIGDGSAITQRQWDVFRATGTVHLFVVSGLQIALTGGLVFALGRLWWRLPLGANRRRHYLFGIAPAWAAALTYALMAGFGLPLQRSLIMFSVLLGAQLARREWAVSTSWILALWLTLLCDPLAVLDVGFWFSFIAVAAILLAVSGRRECRRGAGPWHWLGHWLGQWSRVQWAIFVAAAPVLLILAGQVTLLSLPANLIAIPLSTLVSMPLVFLALLCDPVAPGWGVWLWHGADLSLVWLLRYLELLQQHGVLLRWQPSGLGAPGIGAAALAAMLWLLPRGMPGRALAPVLCVPLLWPPGAPIAPGGYRVTVIDVGQGLSVLVETAAHRLLYDTGPSFGPERSAADLAVLPLLQHSGIRTLDTVVVSHRDSDHAGGYPALAQHVGIARLLVGDSIDPGRETFCRAGLHWRWDGVDFDLLHPDSDRFTGNNRSCVLQVRADGAATLLPGDIERSAEFHLLDNPQLQRETIVVAPHHGSRSSSSNTFIEAVQPRYVVFSTGYRNRFRHPAAAIVRRYREHGAELFDTARDGALIFAVEGGRVARVTRTRTQQRHYWD